MTNEQLLAELKKAGITTDTTGGLLTVEQYNKFITSAVAMDTFMNKIRVERNIGTSRELNLMGVNSRILRAAGETNTFADGDLSAVNTSKKTLVPKKVRLARDISLDELHQNIEGSGLEETINNLFATQFANDLMDLGINGKVATDPADPDYLFLKIIDGWLVKMAADPDKHFYSRGDSRDWKGIVFSAIIKKMPEKFLNLPGLSFFVGRNVDDEYRDQLGERITSLGDVMIQTNPPTTFKGYPVERLPFLPDGAVLFTVPTNLAVGFGRDMSVFRFVNGRKDVVEYTTYASVDFNHVETDKLVYCL